MRPASTRLLRVGLALGTALGAYTASPLARILPVVTVVAADDRGLGAGGAGAAYNCVLEVSIVLAFIFGFAMRDVLQRYAMRARARKKAASAPPRA